MRIFIMLLSDRLVHSTNVCLFFRQLCKIMNSECIWAIDNANLQ